MALVPQTTSSEDVTIDTLPYVETVHQDYEDYALALIEDEMKQIQPRPMKKLPPINFRTTTMEAEYTSRVIDGEFQPREALSFQPQKIARPNALDEWRSVAIPQVRARFEAERIRGIILEAEREEAVQKWKDYNSLYLEKMRDQWGKELEQQREAVEEVNFQRQEAQQQQLGPQIDQLTTDYQQMLYRRNQLEHAIHGLREEQK